MPFTQEEKDRFIYTLRSEFTFSKVAFRRIRELLDTCTDQHSLMYRYVFKNDDGGSNHAGKWTDSPIEAWRDISGDYVGSDRYYPCLETKVE